MFGLEQDNQKNKRVYKTGAFCFIAIEIALYLGFLWMDIMGQYTSLSTGFKFTGIVLCFLWVIVRLDRENVDTLVMTGALFFTVCADVCLLLTEYFTIGLVFFSVVQLIYLVRIHQYTGRSIGKSLVIRGSVIAVVLLVLNVTGVVLDLLLVLTVFYFTNISSNVYQVVNSYVGRRNRKSDNKWGLFVSGMILFLLCDINVGLYNMSSYVVLEHGIYQMMVQFASIGMWLFYLPAQVLIARSSGVKWGDSKYKF